MIKQDQKHFNMLLQNEKISADVLSFIDQLYLYATNLLNKKGTNISAINMLRNFIRLKCPFVNDAFTMYITTYSRVILDPKTDYLLSDCAKIVNDTPPSFIKWLISNQNTYKLISAIELVKLQASHGSRNHTFKSKNLPKIVPPNNNIRYRNECCPGCGKKFKVNSSSTIETHTCSTVETASSIRTISGGGGPGTGKRS